MNAKDSRIAALARDAATQIGERTAPGRLEVEALGLQITACLLRCHSNLGAVSRLARTQTGGLTPRQLRLTLDRMCDTRDQEPSLAELAAAVGLSTKHFARAFLQSTGQPPHQWLIAKRVERSVALLADPAVALADVALASGFADQSHFTLAFRKALGITPGRYRRDRLL